MSRHAVVLLTWQPDKTQLEFYRGFRDIGYDVYALVDDADYYDADASVRIVQPKAELCIDAGFKHLNPVITERKQTACSAWEKALYFFSKVETQHEFTWFIEDDVFIPQHESIRLMDQRSSHDLLTSDHCVNWSDELMHWSWYKHVPLERLPLPWAKSMVCAVRFSRKALAILAEFLLWNKDFDPYLTKPPKYFFIEYLFNTLAMHHGCTIDAAKELNTITWRDDWSCTDMKLTNLYHPIKIVPEHHKIRASLFTA